MIPQSLTAYAEEIPVTEEAEESMEIIEETEEEIPAEAETAEEEEITPEQTEEEIIPEEEPVEEEIPSEPVAEAKEELPPVADPMADEDKDIRPITVDETVTVDIDTAGKMIYYEFTPETAGHYVFQSSGTIDTYCTLYDADFNQLKTDDDSAGNSQFKLVYKMETGVTYYYGARLYSSGNTGSFEATLSVYEPIQVTELAFGAERYAVRPGNYWYYTNYLTKTPSNAESEITVTSSNEEIAAVSGTSIRGVAAGTATITATADNGISASTELLVGNYASSISKSNYNTVALTIGQTYKPEYTLYPTDATDEVVTWSIDSGSDYISIAEDGTVTALAAGTASVRATIMSGSYVSWSIRVYEDLTSLSFKKEENYLRTGNNTNIWNLLNYEPSNASGYPLTITSSNEEIVRISGNYVYGDAAGTATVTVSDGKELSATATFNIGNYASGISKTDWNTINLSIGGTFKPEYTLYPTDATDEVVTWSVDSGSDYISVAEDGTITALAAGSATVRATILSGGYQTWSVRVYEDLTSLSFKKEANYLRTGNSTYIWNLLNYEPSNANGYPLTITSSNEEIVRISGNYVYGDAAGTATVTVSDGKELSATATFNIGNYATSISKTDWNTIGMKIGETFKPEYTLYPEDASDEVVTWSIDSGSDYISIAEDGTITALAAGTGRVRATILSGGYQTWSIRVYEDVTSLSFSKENYYLRPDYSQYIWDILDYEPDNAYGYPLTIISSNEEVARVDGNYVYGVAAGTAEITVTANDGITATAAFTVGNYATGITRNTWGDINLKVGETKQLDYVLYPSNGDTSDDKVTFYLDGENSCISVTEDGLVTALSGGYGYVTAETLSGYTQSYYIHVYTDPTSLTFKKEVSYLGVNYNRYIWDFLNYTPNNASGYPLTITSSNEEVIKVEGNYLYGISKGTAEITVSSDNGITATGTFEVGNYASSISRNNYDDIYLGIGDTKKLEYTLYPTEADLSDEVVTWTVTSGTKTVTVSEDGTVTALSGGTANVRAEIRNGDSVTYYVRVYVEPASLTFRKSMNYVRISNSSDIWNYLNYVPDYAYKYPVTVTSSNEEVIRVEDTYIYPEAKGTAEITVTADNGVTTKATFEVGNYATSIGTNDYSRIYLKAGDTRQLSYYLYPRSGDFSDEEVTWSVTSGSGFVSVDENGLVTALAAGNATVTVTTKSGYSVNYSITVYAEPVTLAFRDEISHVGVNTSNDIWNYLNYQPNLAYRYPLTITSNDESIVRVDGTAVYGVAKGTAEITVVADNGVTAKGTFETGYYATSIGKVDYDDIYIGVGDTKQLEYTLSGADTSDEVVTWSLEYANNNCITLDENGLITAVAGGRARVRATIMNGRSTSFYIIVYEDPQTLSFKNETNYLDKHYSHEIWSYLDYTSQYAYGYPLSITSSDESIVRVDGNWLYGGYDGTVTLTVTTENGLSTTAEFTVGNYAGDITHADSSDIYLKKGETKQLEYTLQPEGYDFSEEEVTWSVMGNGTSGIASVDQNGVVTAKRIGSVNIRATIKNGNYTTYYVRVVDEPKSIKFNESAYFLDKYNSKNIWNYLTVGPESARSCPITITSSDQNVVYVSGNNIYGRNSGTATVTVETENGLSASATFTVGNYAGSISTANYSGINMLAGDETQLEYVLNPTGGDFTEEEVVWSVENDLAGCIRLDETGKVTALKTGYAYVRATIKNGNYVTFYINVSPDPKKISFGQLDYYLGIGGQRNVWADLYVNPTTSRSFGIELASSNENAATVDSELIYGKAAGTSIITVTADDGLSTKARYHIGNYAVSIQAKDGAEKKILKGDTLQLEFIATGNDDCSDDEFTWNITYSPNNCIRLSETGLVTAVESGEAQVSVTSKSGVSTGFIIYVYEKPTEFKFTASEYNTEVGMTQSIRLTSTPSTAYRAGVVWESSDPSVAEINSSYDNYAYISVLKEGTATIRAVSKLDDKVYAECKINGYNPVDPTSITVSSNVTAYVGYTNAISIRMQPEKANQYYYAEVNNDNISILQSSGRGALRITGLKAGTSVITITSENEKQTAKVNVNVVEGIPEIEGSWDIFHLNTTDRGYYRVADQSSEEYVLVAGEGYDFEYAIDYTAYSSVEETSFIKSLIECGLFEDVVPWGIGSSEYSALYGTYAKAAKAGTTEIELLPGHPVKVTVIDSAWLGTKVTADSSIPADIVNAFKESDLGVQYDSTFYAAELDGLDSLSVNANQKAVVQSWLDVKIDSYEKDAFGNITFKLTADAKAKVVALAKTAANTSDGTALIAETKLNGYERMQFVLPMASVFGDDYIRSLTVTHKASNGKEYTYDALYDEQTLYFYSTNGYGTFTITGVVSGYKDPVYTWTKTENGYDVTAVSESVDEADPTLTETVTAVYSVEKEPECMTEGVGVYTAVFTNPVFETQTKKVSIPAIGHHEYGTPTYTWASDFKTVTAKAVCTVCGEELTETVETVYEVIQEATADEDGSARYTATFTNELFETQTKDVVLPAKGHTYGTPEYTWSEDNSTVTAVSKCTDCDRQITETVETTYEVIKEPGCEEKGIGRYTAHFTNELFETQTKDVEIEARGHVYGEPEYTWSRDNKTATAKAVCTVCGDEVTETVNTTYEVLEEPTLEEPGKGKYTAVFTNELFETQTKEVEIPSLSDKSAKDIVLDKNELTILFNASAKLNATVLPEDCEDKTVKWSSSDSSIVTVDANGNVKGVKPGKATVTAETVNGLTDTCEVRVLFTDVAVSSQYFFTPVYWAVDNGITVGAGGPGKFSPTASCTREQFVTFLWRLNGEPEPKSSSNFSDVNRSDWYYKPITWAAENGITVGLNDGTGRFGVGQACTREQCVTFLHRSVGSPEPAGTMEFTDSQAGRYYYKAIKWAAGKGITVGLNDGTGRFGVGQKCTRGMLVTFLYRFDQSK
ncbi:MAG: Ig-like domain-containing protein [Erysipelotrichaceae bacterium]|nr:Ig-like domain-containing protein [Erysipelotrichaceae bacterium]